MTSMRQTSTSHRIKRTTVLNMRARSSAGRCEEMLSMGVTEVAQEGPRGGRFRAESNRLSSNFWYAVGQWSPRSLPAKFRSERSSQALGVGPQNFTFGIPFWGGLSKKVTWEVTTPGKKNGGDIEATIRDMFLRYRSDGGPFEGPMCASPFPPHPNFVHTTSFIIILTFLCDRYKSYNQFSIFERFLLVSFFSFSAYPTFD